MRRDEAHGRLAEQGPRPGRREAMLTLVGGLFGLAACGPQAHASDPSHSGTGPRAPDFTIDLVSGETFRLSEHLGKDVVVLDFWTTFCQPCVGALQHLNEFYVAKKSRGLIVLAVAMDPPDTSGNIVPFVRSHNLTMPVAHDVQSRVTDLYNKKSLAPYQVLIARDGRIIKQRESYQPGDESGMESDINVALDITLSREISGRARVDSSSVLRSVPTPPGPSGGPSPLPSKLLIRRATGLLIAIGALSLHGQARAEGAGDTQLKVTETAVINYHADNRNEQRVDDKYGEWLNRLNVQLNNGPFTAQIRLDSALYALKPDPNKLALADADANPADILQRSKISQISVEEARRAYITGQTTSYGRDLSTRYVNTVYASKMALSYTIPGLEIAVGDTYAQLGRGLVLALRKADELAADTTLRGVKVDFRPDLGAIKLNITALAGYTNPLRVDEVSGIQLTQSGSALFPLAPKPRETSYISKAEPNFATDRIIGGKVEQGTKNIMVGVQGMLMTRGTAEFQTGQDVSPSRNAGEISIGSLSLLLPNLASHGSFYVEGALQGMNKPIELPDTGDSGIEQRALLRRLSGGTAVYAQLNLFEGPFTLSLEGKHYDRFFPLLATVGGSSAIPFQALQYNGVPTTEPITSDTQFEQFNVCVTGGRARLDYRAGEGVLLYGSFGRYVTYTERSQNCGQDRQANDNGTLLPPAGKTDAIRNDIVDPYIGFEISTDHNRTHAYASTGIRIDDAATASPYDGLVDPTTIYYREHYVRYDAVKKIFGPFSIQTAGFHRYRFHPLRSPTPWREGENYLSLIYSPIMSGAFGVEYSTYGGELKMFYNGQIQYRITTDTVVRLFVGQTRPALRCVSGVCRQFPAFEGAKLEAVVRFLTLGRKPRAWGSKGGLLGGSPRGGLVGFHQLVTEP